MIHFSVKAPAAKTICKPTGSLSEVRDILYKFVLSLIFVKSQRWSKESEMKIKWIVQNFKLLILPLITREISRTDNVLVHLMIHLFLIFSVQYFQCSSLLVLFASWYYLLHMKEMAAIRRSILFLHSCSYIPEHHCFMTHSPSLCVVRALVRSIPFSLF